MDWILGLMGAVILALMTFLVAANNKRFDSMTDQLNKTEHRLERVENKIDALQAQYGKIDTIERQIQTLIDARR